MKDNIHSFIDKIDNKNIAFILEDDLLIDTIDLDNIKGNIYRAKVLRELKNLDGFEIDLGLEKKALLRKSRALESTKPSKDVLVQVLKVPENNKLIEVSQKLRLNSSDYEEIIKEEKLLPTPKLIREASLDEFTALYENINVKNYSNDYKEIFGIEEGNSNQVISFDKSLKEYASNVIETKAGSTIVIDKVEALTVIDINTSKLSSSNNIIEAYAVNSKIVKDIVRIIKIKNIKKMLVIDFLRMKKREEKNSIDEILRNELGLNKISYKAFGFTKMGLYEIIIQ